MCDTKALNKDHQHKNTLSYPLSILYLPLFFHNIAEMWSFLLSIKLSGNDLLRKEYMVWIFAYEISILRRE